MDSMVNVSYVRTQFSDSITNIEYSQIEGRFGNELQLLRSLSGHVLSKITGRHRERSRI